ncbi:dihydrofolate reductase family protein [Deinococcus sp. HMF7604]|uniref:dihydrofolate reductase family protein n=1 Tax=Deinococcus betulae TaxID=2873312 RepID=UPI001CCC6B53|nr:dihydrofolate reductase family protein [Deinococcus betulae]MBZ9753266.1 dihydrofolate reductase family protein [Deinococcus betulae]
MAKVVFGMTMSLDGFINDAHGKVGLLYPDLRALGQSQVMQEALRTTGAVVMGRRTFDAPGDPDSYAEDYEFQVPIFVVTRRPPETKPKENDRLRITFVGTPEDAVRQAKEVAGEQDVVVVGGPSIGQHLLRAGLVDELQIGVMPQLLGSGQRLFEHLADLSITLKKTRLIETGQRTDLYFSVER